MRYRGLKPNYRPKNGRLVWIPKDKKLPEVTLINDKPFPLLQADKNSYSFMAEYQPSKGKLKIRYAQ